MFDLDTTFVAFVAALPCRPYSAFRARLLDRSRALSLKEMLARLSARASNARREQVIARLRERAPNVRRRCDRLVDIAHQAHLLALFRAFFLKEWEIQSALSRPVPGQLSTCERAFLRLIDRDLFPLYDPDWGQDDDLPAGIYVQFAGIDLEAVNDSVGEIEPSLLLLIFLWNPDALETPAVERLLDTFGELPQLGWDHRQLHPVQFRALCRSHGDTHGDEKGQPWTLLPDALAVVAHDTGNVFLDPWPDDCLDDMPWSAGNLRALQDEWVEARATLLALDHIVRWLDAEPENVPVVIDLVDRGMAMEADDDADAPNP